MLGGGLAGKKKKAVSRRRGLTVNPTVKDVDGAGVSRVVTDYLAKTGLQPLSGSTRIQYRRVRFVPLASGNSGPLHPNNRTSGDRQTITFARPQVLSGNIANFEGANPPRNIKANFLMSPPLVVGVSRLAGRVNIDMGATNRFGNRSRGKRLSI